MKREYHIEAHGDAVEHYSVEAESEEEARELFESGQAGQAWYTEINGSAIYRISEES